MVDTESMEFVQEPLMINFIKGLVEIHDYDVSLASPVMGVIQIPSELSFTAKTTMKTMLIFKERVISVKMGHNVGVYDMLSIYLSSHTHEDILGRCAVASNVNEKKV